MRVTRHAVLFYSSLLLAACANGPGKAMDLSGTKWHLVTADAGVLAKHAPTSGVTLEFTADRVNGFGGCNKYSGAYTFSAGTLSVGPVTATKRGCMDAAGAIENAWFDTLASKLTVTQDANGLQLRAADGAQLRFASGPASGPKR